MLEMSWITAILQLYSQVVDHFGNVIVTRINIRLFDLLARFYYILNLPRMIEWSPRCYIPSFVEIGLPVPKKKIFKGFLPYVGIAAILVMGPASCHQLFISLYLKAFINQSTNGPVNAHLVSWPS